MNWYKIAQQNNEPRLVMLKRKDGDPNNMYGEYGLEKPKWLIKEDAKTYSLAEANSNSYNKDWYMGMPVKQYYKDSWIIQPV